MVKPLNALTTALALCVNIEKVQSDPYKKNLEAHLFSSSGCGSTIKFQKRQNPSESSLALKVLENLNDPANNIKANDWLKPIIDIHKTTDEKFVGKLFLVKSHHPLTSKGHLLGKTTPSKEGELGPALKAILTNHSSIVNSISRVQCKNNMTHPIDHGPHL